MTTFKEQIEGFPTRQMIIISLIRFLEPLAFTSLFPYLYFMIRDFHVAKDEKDIAKFSGYLGSSFAFCQFLFCVRWGKLSNRIGRKPVLLCGLMGTSISLISFGFSTNYYMALCARSLAGVLNGNIAVLRTTVGEIATEKRHQALAFSTLPLLYNFGSVIGPLIGGSRLFTRPNLDDVYNNSEESGFLGLYESFITKHPYALSNIVVSCFLWFSMICGFLFLEETNKDFVNRRDYGLDLGDIILKKLGLEVKQRPWHIISQKQNDRINEETPLLINDSSTNINEEDSDDSSSPFTPQVITAITSNFMVSLHGIIYSEFTPVFLGSRFMGDKLKFPFTITGGFGLDPSMIGTLFSSTGVMGMLIVLLIFPYIDRKWGTIKGYRFSLSIFPFVYFLLPLSIFSLHQYHESFPSWLTPIILYSLTCLRTLASATGLPQIMLLTHRAAPNNHRAYVNSFTMSMLALARCVGPFTFGYIMSFGDQHRISWLGWWLLSFLSTFGVLQSFTMADYDD